MSNFE
jgi:hypothetical protein